MSNRLPIRALDVQLDLLRYYTNDELGRRYADNVIEVALADHAKWTPGMGQRLHRMMLIGDTYAVTAEIGNILEQTATSIPKFVFHADDLPSPSGFVWLEQAIIIPDINNRPLAVQALGWHVTPVHTGNVEDMDVGDDGPVQPCVLTLAWTAPSDPRDYAHDAFLNEEPHLVMPHGLVSMLTGVWPIGETWPTNEADMGLGQFLLAFLRFLATPWIAADRHTLDRHQARRAVRAVGSVEHVPEVRIVQLRRRAAERSEATGTGNVEWSHRWIVGPFWRDQWYPSLGVHKPILIAPYIKGPEHLPLVVHDKVFSVER